MAISKRVEERRLRMEQCMEKGDQCIDVKRVEKMYCAVTIKCLDLRIVEQCTVGNQCLERVITKYMDMRRMEQCTLLRG